jgi:hypothetical protein
MPSWCGVFEGEASREELIAYLMRLGDAEATLLRQPGRKFKTFELLDSVISVATDIGAVEMLERIRGWFADELPDPTIADLPWVEAHISRPFEVNRDETLGRGKGCVRSVKTEIGWWAGFSDNEPAKLRPRAVTRSGSTRHQDRPQRSLSLR